MCSTRAQIADGPACIYGGIVTFNPGLDRLAENISAIATQVHTLLVFDNGSNNVGEIAALIRDATTDTSSVELIAHGRNAGMSVALNTLTHRAKEEGATSIILLDQDSVAPTDLVEMLVAHAAPDVGIVCPRIQDRNESTGAFDSDLVLEVPRAITSGSLVNLQAWEDVGGYDERLFVDWVDNEYCDNLRAHGYRIVQTQQTTLLHEMGEREYAWSSPGVDDTRKAHLAKEHYRQNYPAWRWEDRARGQAIAIHKYGLTKIGFEERAIFLRATLGRILLIERHKRACLKAVAKGYRSGLKTWKRTRRTSS